MVWKTPRKQKVKKTFSFGNRAFDWETRRFSERKFRAIESSPGEAKSTFVISFYMQDAR